MSPTTSQTLDTRSCTQCMGVYECECKKVNAVSPAIKRTIDLLVLVTIEDVARAHHPQTTSNHSDPKIYACSHSIKQAIKNG